MILGYSTNAYTEFSLNESIERIAKLGFGGLEIMGDKPHLYPPDYDDNALEQLKAHLDQHNLAITNLNSFTLFAVGDTYLPSWIETDKNRREIRIQHTLDSLRVAHRLGCENISIPPAGPLEENMTRKEAFRLFYQGLDRVIPLAEELNVKILVEPEPDLLMERTSEFLPFIKEICSEAVGLNFDIGHFFCVGEDPAEAFETLFQWVGHVHVEDIGADRKHHHLIAGQGAIDLKNVFGVMASLGYKHNMSLELYPYVDQPDEAGRQSLAHMLPLIRESGIRLN
jgi:sugar phosphate isomerase/epimerase